MSSKRKIRSFNARYNMNVSDSDNERTNTTEFISYVNPSASSNFNRRYNNNGTTFNQTLHIELPDLKRLLFGDRKLANITFGLSNEANLLSTTNDNRVADWDNTSKGYSSINTYLTNDLRTNTFSEAPAISLQKNYSKQLSNRFYRNLSFHVAAKHKLIYQNNRSDKSFQNISRNYSNFIPEASIQYYKTQFGEYGNNFTIRFTNDVRIPNIDQLAPLTDSADVYRLQRGNLNLREAKVKDLNVYFYHNDLRSKNTLNYNINASVNFVNDSFADSSYVDESNRRIVYVTNIDGYQSANLGGDIRKSLKLKQNALQIQLSSFVNYSKNPGYVNEAFNYSNNLNSTSNISLNYTYKGKIAFETRETYNYSQSKQRALQTDYRGTNLTSTFSGSYNVTKKFTLNSNVSLNNSRSVSFASDRIVRNPAVNYNIWNASAIYRFTKGNNAELKFTALDLLRQNKSIINSSNDLGFTFARRNVLQQYFMTTFSYYPRQFGKNGGKK
ncbi:hypothetical protein [Desertivirga arenae]|uniref:hypothetical protein n=1 Tax=Desertivirga arenae TaxID=2810309 RepID=UPI001A95C87D|nr:hypothetical protein [Pedobacter sp. SYSU D00823]